MMETNKYIIEIPDNTAWLQWVKVSDKDGHVCFDFKDPEDLTPYTEPDMEQVRKEAYEEGYKLGYYSDGYQRGLKDAWDAARKIAKLNTDEQKRLFGCFGIYFIAHEFSAHEAIEKIRQYEQENEGLGIQGYFKRGDEVIDADGTKAVILRVSEDNYCQVYTKNGCIYNWHIHTYKFHKTGRNFPEIAEVLKKMQEG